MSSTKRANAPRVVCGALFICNGPLVRPDKESISPIMEHGTEVLHVLSGPDTYKVYAKMGGLLYSLGKKVQLILVQNGNAMLRNPGNENDHTLFTIPEWLFKQDFVPADAVL